MLANFRTGQGVRVAIVYVHPAANQPKYGPAARRFADSYTINPPGETDHEIIVCINGGNGHGPYQDKLFSPLPVRYMEHSNWGKDIGAFQQAAEHEPCDLLVCFGSHVHFHRPGWLDRMARVYEENGPALYGAWGFHHPRPHIRTTALWLPPELLRMYPYQISDPMRYEFEHGEKSLTLWCKKMGFDTLMVTFNAVLPMDKWRHAGCEESLFGDQHQNCL